MFFPKEAPWLADLEAELFAFPSGRHDDQVDSISQALGYKSPSPWTDASLDGYCNFMNALFADAKLWAARRPSMVTKITRVQQQGE